MTTLLLFGDTERSPAMRHEVPLTIDDSFMFADIDGRRAVLTSSLERARIAAVLPDAKLLDFTALGMRELIEQGHSRLEAQGEVAVGAVSQLEITAAVIPWDFPVATRPGVTGRELYDATCDLFEAAGYATQRTGDPDNTNEGFQFALGHGVGLEVHEPPGLGLSGHEPFVAGDVVAVEPGLWDARIGGVRFEDLLLVTDNGAETLTRFPYALTPGS